MIKAQDLFPIMQQKLEDVSEVLSLHISIVYHLLHAYKWNKENLLEEAFMEDFEAVTKKVGVYNRNQDNGKRKALKISEASLTCPICFDIFKSEEMIAMPCSHSFCKDCWRGYLTSKIGDGPSCTLSFCPAVGCHELVTEIEVQSAVPDLLEKYRSYQLRNFVDFDQCSRWCIGTDCEHIAVMQNHADVDEKLVAICEPCNISFCMKCGEEPHAPINCCALKDWNALCKSESANVQWIISKTKPCPKCGSRIEKNQGCNHMRCLKCQHGFCWVCGEEVEHSAIFQHSCNKFRDDGESKSQSKRDADRYVHCYVRFEAHGNAQNFARDNVKRDEKRLKDLEKGIWKKRANDEKDRLETLLSANKELIECRRMLKFTYPFRYFLKVKAKDTADDAIEDQNSVPREKLEEIRKSTKMQPSGMYGSHRKDWHKTSHFGARKLVMDTISELLLNQRPDATPQLIGRLAYAVFELEADLYKTASSLEEYENYDTFKTRLQESGKRLLHNLEERNQENLCSELDKEWIQISSVPLKVESKNSQQMQIERFEYHQEMLERITEELNSLVEKPIYTIDIENIKNRMQALEVFRNNILEYVEEECFWEGGRYTFFVQDN
jgi:ariadne-1